MLNQEGMNLDEHVLTRRYVIQTDPACHVNIIA